VKSYSQTLGYGDLAMAEQKAGTGRARAILIMSGLLSVGFGFSGAAKLAGVKALADNFARWGYPPAFLYFTGALEVLCGLLIWHPGARMPAILLMMATMVGAVGTHVLNHEALQSGPAAFLLVLAATVGHLRREELFTLLRK
jgi:uncharacterized membrane protein YphA (DoxX/SURF4 family)